MYWGVKFKGRVGGGGKQRQEKCKINSNSKKKSWGRARERGELGKTNI